MQTKSFLKKTWHFIWHDDSWASWLVNLVLAFILVKFVIYPIIGLMLSTSYPVVAVVSSSMHHSDSDFNTWWDANKDYYLAKNIDKEEFEKFPFHNGFNKGDIMVLKGRQPKDIKVGDILIYQSSLANPIIHRVTQIEQANNKYIFTAKGDNNIAQDPKPVTEEQIKKTGVAIFKIPFLGYIKIWFNQLTGL